MSQENVIHSAPESQQFVREGGTEYVSRKNRKDLCACCDQKIVGCDMCCFGCLCPFVLIGSSHKMKENGFTEKTDFCSGCCDGACLGIFFGNVLGDVCFGAGPLVGAGFATSCNVLHKRSDCDCLVDYFQYLFCMPCRSCADYSSALAQVEANIGKKS